MHTVELLLDIWLIHTCRLRYIVTNDMRLDTDRYMFIGNTNFKTYKLNVYYYFPPFIG